MKKLSYSNFTMYEEPFNIITKGNLKSILDYTFKDATVSDAPNKVADYAADGGGRLEYDIVKGGFFPFNSNQSKVANINLRQATPVLPSKFSDDTDFNNVAGKGKLCKAAGLTGADKSACKSSIIKKCGHQPFCPPIFGSSKCFKKRLDWEDCAKAVPVSAEQAVQTEAEKLIPNTPENTDMSTGAKLMIGAAVIGALALVGFGVSNRIRANKLATAANLSAA